LVLIFLGEELSLLGYFSPKGTVSVEKGLLLYVPLHALWRWGEQKEDTY